MLRLTRSPARETGQKNLCLAVTVASMSQRDRGGVTDSPLPVTATDMTRSRW